ncbi:glycoside hydrolase family 16 protein [Kitasatospora sp. NPDC086791]|uniref:glycoside hydrolase family 16 protein n=1 Tax=Kitasatospora sp. NPDC086791 TaxID=3155178 RepID=UPI00342369D2
MPSSAGGVADGILDIIAKPDDVTSGTGKRYHWSSCMINTSPSYSFRYGSTEVRAKFPAAKGFWPALWTWEAPGVSLPGNGETDIFEFYSNDHSRVHLSQRASGRNGVAHRLPFDPTAGFHVYGVDIEPGGNGLVDRRQDGASQYRDLVRAYACSPRQLRLLRDPAGPWQPGTSARRLCEVLAEGELVPEEMNHTGDCTPLAAAPRGPLSSACSPRRLGPRESAFSDPNVSRHPT